MAKKNFIQFLSDTERYEELDALTQLVKDYYTSDENDDFNETNVENTFNDMIVELFSQMNEKYSTTDEDDIITEETIYAACNEGDDINDVVDRLEQLGNLKFVDEKIDDGLDEDCEDEYLMMSSYTLSTDNQDFYIRLYYGNNTHTLSCAFVNEE